MDLHFSEYDTRLAGYAVIVNDSNEILLSWFNGGGEPSRACGRCPAAASTTTRASRTAR